MTRFGFQFVAAAAVVGIVGCSEAPTGTIETAPDVPVSRQVIQGGATFQGFIANNDGAEFWDAGVIDGPACNAGHYAQGPFGDCAFEIAGSDANAGQFPGSQFLGTNGGADPAPILFEPGTYRVVFLGGYRGALDEQVGFFTRAGGLDTTHIDAAISSAVNGEVTFTVNSNWGFFVVPVNPIAGGDGQCGLEIMCSDDAMVQQFALFRGVGSPTKYLLGIEDEPGVQIPPAGEPTSQPHFPAGGGDKDFNDFFLSIERIAVNERLDGRMTGGGRSDALPKLNVGLTIHCDNKLSNNINITWGQGAGTQKFHMDKNSLTNVVCQLAENPAPPVAPINIFSGTATGRFNNVPGATLDFKFVDRGEPNKGGDAFSLLIRDANGNVVLNVPEQPFSNGNLQAHFDQPHGQKANGK